MSRRILIRLAYDGGDFSGYQIQREGRTVQGVLEEALAAIHDHPVGTVAAGRTDTGVHARGQYVSFTSDRETIPVASFAAAINSALPPDVRVLNARAVREEFHARYDATARHYRYHLYHAPVFLPYRRRYAWRVAHELDLERLNRDAAQLVGEHDFATFATGTEEGENTVRRVLYAHFRYRAADDIEFGIGADGFLRRMVRSIVGTLIEREMARSRGGEPTLEMGEILAARDRSFAGTSAPPQGLFLHEVEYRDE